MGSGFAAAKAFIPPNQNKMERAQPRMLHPAGVGSLTSSLPAPGITQHRDRAGGLGCPRGLKGVSGGRSGVTETTGGQPGMGWGWGSVLSSAAGRSRGHVFGCFPASAVRTSIFSSCNRSHFGAFPVKWLGRGMPCAWSGAPCCCSQSHIPGDRVPRVHPQSHQSTGRSSARHSPKQPN